MGRRGIGGFRAASLQALAALRIEVARRPLGLALAVLAAGGLAGCGQSDEAAQDAAAAAPTGEMVFYRGNAAEPATLDPHHTQGIWESDIVGDLLIPLTTADANGEAMPGAATSWDISEDGLSWTFHLREHVWSDGVPVSAEDFVFAWRRILDPATASAYAYYLYPIKNAVDVNGGRMPVTDLGVEAPDDRTLIVHLENPAPYLAEFMTHSVTSPLPRHALERHGTAWSRPGNYLSNGAYVLEEWIPNDHVTAVRNPLFYDAANVAVDRVVYYPTQDYAAALQRFRAGEIDIQSRLPSVQIDWIRENIPEAIDLKPTLAIEYMAMNFQRPGLDDVRVREALSLALDRETLVNQVRRVGEPPAYSMIPPGIANYPGNVRIAFADMPQAERLARARMLMEEAGYGPDRRLRFGYAVRSASADARRVPAAIQQMWSEIYVDAEIEQSDAAVFYDLIQEHEFDVAQAGWVADFNDASNFLDLLRTGNSNNYSQYVNPEYDALLDQAMSERDLEARGRLMARAEEMALNDHPWIPMHFIVSDSLQWPYVKGWITNANDTNRTRWITIDEESRAAQFPGRYGR